MKAAWIGLGKMSMTVIMIEVDGEDTGRLHEMLSSVYPCSADHKRVLMDVLGQIEEAEVDRLPLGLVTGVKEFTREGR